MVDVPCASKSPSSLAMEASPRHSVFPTRMLLPVAIMRPVVSGAR